MKRMAEVTGIWLRRSGDRCELLIEVAGSWRHVPVLSGELGDCHDNFPCSEIIEMSLDRFPLEQE